jgi:hypothetical protein
MNASSKTGRALSSLSQSMTVLQNTWKLQRLEKKHGDKHDGLDAKF